MFFFPPTPLQLSDVIFKLTVNLFLQLLFFSPLASKGERAQDNLQRPRVSLEVAVVAKSFTKKKK